MIGTDTVTLVKRTSTTIDELGSAVVTETTVTVTGCSFHVKATADDHSGQTSSTATEAKVYMPVTEDTTAITSRDAIRFGGRTFEVQGDRILARRMDGDPSHVRVNVKAVVA